MPELDANANAVAIQTIKLENEGWDMDEDVTEPEEPSFVIRHESPQPRRGDPAPGAGRRLPETYKPAPPLGGASQ